MWPIALLNGLRIRLRNKLFELGIWKSVEFDVPVVYVGSLAGESTTAISFLISDLLGAPMHVRHLPDLTTSASDKNKSPYLYLESYQDIMFSTTHKVLGISEWIQHHDYSEAIVMDQSFIKNEIRPQIRILVSNFEGPFFKDELWPVGRLGGSKSEIREADVIIFCNTPIDADTKEVETMARKFLTDKASIFFVKNTSTSLSSFNSSDKIEFLKDHDNFARLITNVLPNTNPDSE